MYYIFSFRSRSQSIAFYELVTRERISAKLINTPRAVSVGCGLSVKVACNHIDAARALFALQSYHTFLGLFYYNGSQIVRIER